MGFPLIIQMIVCVSAHAQTPPPANPPNTPIQPSAAANPANPYGAIPLEPGAANIPLPPGKLDVKDLKQRYWANGSDTQELKVVQNKLYPKGKKFEVSVLGSVVDTDPFLSVHSLGMSLNYNLNEFFAISAIARKDFVADSDARIQLRVLNTTTNSNPSAWFAGGGLEYTPIYGKLSIFGVSIAHYDLHLDLGGGVTSTTNGNYFTPYVGIGQVYYFAKWLGFRADYRMLFYQESIIEHVDPSKLGSSSAHNSFNDMITLGVSFFFGFF